MSAGEDAVRVTRMMSDQHLDTSGPTPGRRGSLPAGHAHLSTAVDYHRRRHSLITHSTLTDECQTNKQPCLKVL
jgi:hypothetical protein